MDSPVASQLREFRRKLPADMLRRWEQPAGISVLLKIFQDWAIIVAGYLVFMHRADVPGFVVAVGLMSWGQKGLSTLAHDAIHRNLTSNKRLNDLLSDTFLCPALMSTARSQRESHAAHHNNLGTSTDPDHGLGNETSLKHYRTRVFHYKSIPALFLYDVLDPTLFQQNAMGSLAEYPLQILTWWSALAGFLCLLDPSTRLGWDLGSSDIGISYAVGFLVPFHVARCTVGYATYVLREIIDHSGLPSSSILRFTRSSPWGSFFQKYMQPHDDNYHLLHHLAPKIPMSRLRDADNWLRVNCPEYAQAHHYSTYIFGSTPLLTEGIHQK